MRKSRKFSGNADEVLLKMWKKFSDEEKIKYFFSYMNFHKKILKELKYLFFLALYGRDFTEKQKKKIKIQL